MAGPEWWSLDLVIIYLSRHRINSLAWCRGDVHGTKRNEQICMLSWQGGETGGDKKTLERLTGLADQLVATGDYSILITSCVERFITVLFWLLVHFLDIWILDGPMWDEKYYITALRSPRSRENVECDVTFLHAYWSIQNSCWGIRQATQKKHDILVAPQRGTCFVLDTVQLSTRTHLKR